MTTSGDFNNPPLEYEPVPPGERFLIRTEGGPMGGETRVANADGGSAWTWPLPTELTYGREGRYVKVQESDLEPQGPEPGVVRSATYRWEAGQ